MSYPEWKKLPPKQLRKMSGNMVREIAGAEIMKMFLAHGNPAPDPLANLYSNKPWHKQHAATEQV